MDCAAATTAAAADAAVDGELLGTQSDDAIGNSALLGTQSDEVNGNNALLGTQSDEINGNNALLGTQSDEESGNNALLGTEDHSDSNQPDAVQLAEQPQQDSVQFSKLLLSHPGIQQLKLLQQLQHVLPNIRLCQGSGQAACFVSSDPFSLSESVIQQLLQLRLKSIIDLRFVHERKETDDADVYRHFRCVDWQLGQKLKLPAHRHEDRVVYRFDFTRCRQQELRAFLGEGGEGVLLNESDAGAFVAAACEERRGEELSVDIADCFHSGFGGVFNLLARAEARPALIVCPDGVERSGIVACLLRLLAAEQRSIIVEEMAVARLQISSSQSQLPPSKSDAMDQREAATESSKRLMQHLIRKYRSPENYLIKCGLTLQQIRQLKTLHDQNSFD